MTRSKLSITAEVLSICQTQGVNHTHCETIPELIELAIATIQSRVRSAKDDRKALEVLEAEFREASGEGLQATLPLDSLFRSNGASNGDGA